MNAVAPSFFTSCRPSPSLFSPVALFPLEMFPADSRTLGYFVLESKVAATFFQSLLPDEPYLPSTLSTAHYFS